MAARIEKDSLGEREVPADVYWGLQTLRAIENFPISGIREHPRMIEAYVMLKKACAIANKELDLLDPAKADAIVKAADEMLEGKLRDQFVVDVFQAGAGTSFNMNVNEALANRAIEILGGTKGQYNLVNPNDDVNYGQSTNDTFPTAMRIATRLLIKEFVPVLDRLIEAFAAKGVEFDHVLKSGRTHLQDAVPIRLGQEFTAYSITMKKCKRLLKEATYEVEELTIGGSAAGTGINTDPRYRFRVVELISQWTGIQFRPAEDMCEAMESQMPMAALGAMLRIIALELTRIANDLRLLCSGPLTGLAEITLPAVQPGSSIMPGKVNPSMAENLNMICYQVIGLAQSIDLATQAGQLELNVMMPLIAYDAHFALEILKNGIDVFTRFAVLGITADADKCRHYAETSPSLATALNPHVGYTVAADVVKQALKEHKSVVDVVRERNLLTEEEIKQIFDPYKMTEPGIPGKDGGK